MNNISSNGVLHVKEAGQFSLQNEDRWTLYVVCWLHGAPCSQPSPIRNCFVQVFAAGLLMWTEHNSTHAPVFQPAMLAHGRPSPKTCGEEKGTWSSASDACINRGGGGLWNQLSCPAVRSYLSFMDLALSSFSASPQALTLVCVLHGSSLISLHPLTHVCVCYLHHGGCREASRLGIAPMTAREGGCSTVPLG
jgi:hypothetical protein